MHITTYSDIFIRYSEAEKPLADIWVIHGFGESGQSFLNIFESVLAGQFTIRVIDLPGFGCSPYCNRFEDISDYVQALTKCIRHFSAGKDVFLIGHSFGGVLGTLVCESAGDLIKGYISVEGNLTEADSYFSGWAGEHINGMDFKEKFLKLLQERSKERKHFENYFANAVFTNPEALIVIGKGSRLLTRGEDAGERYMALTCPTLYIWGDIDTPPITQRYIVDNNVPNVLFKDCSHWMMIDQAELFYKTVFDFAMQALKK